MQPPVAPSQSKCLGLQNVCVILAQRDTTPDLLGLVESEWTLVVGFVHSTWKQWHGFGRPHGFVLQQRSQSFRGWRGVRLPSIGEEWTGSRWVSQIIRWLQSTLRKDQEVLDPWKGQQFLWRMNHHSIWFVDHVSSSVKPKKPSFSAGWHQHSQLITGLAAPERLGPRRA